MCMVLASIGLAPAPYAPSPHVDPVFRSNVVAGLVGLSVLKLGAFGLCVFPSRVGGGPWGQEDDILLNPQNYDDGTPLHYATLNGSDWLVDYYISKAQAKGGQALVEKMVRSTNSHGKAKRSPLHLAALMGQTTIAKALLGYGAHFEERDNFDKGAR